MREKLRRGEVPAGKLQALENESVSTPEFGWRTAFSMLLQTLEASEILQNGRVRAKQLIDWAAELNSRNPEHSKKLRRLPDLGPWPMVGATSYDAIRAAIKVEGGIGRFLLQRLLGKKIGEVLTSDGDSYKQAAEITRPHARAGKNHTAIAEQSISDTFKEFMPKLTSESGVPATDLTVDMIYDIMTKTVFGGYDDEEVKSWKDDIVYFLQHLIDVQQSYAVGLLAEKLPEKISNKLPNPRTLMRLIALKQGVYKVLNKMLSIEDNLFPRIINWIKEQEEKNLPPEELRKMGFLGAVLSIPEEDRPVDMKRADIFGIYTAALDSTANAANWLLAELAQNPKILQQVAKLEGAAREQYIEFIQFELWRKDPITPIIFRQVPLEEEVETDQLDEKGKRIKNKIPGTGRTIDGTYLSPGTIMLLSVGAAGRDPKRFPNPRKFNPDRYYAMTDEEITQVRKDLALVFAAGDPHRCQGEGAVYLTLNALINHMANNFESIEIVRGKNRKKVIIESNDSGVCSPVDKRTRKPLNFRVVPKAA